MQMLGPYKQAVVDFSGSASRRVRADVAVGLTAVLLSVGTAYALSLKPKVTIAVAIAVVLIAGGAATAWAAVAAMLVVGPLFNPVVHGAGSGRIYLVNVLALAAIASGAQYWLRVRRGPIVAVILGAYLALQIATAHGQGLLAAVAWAFRPLQFLALTIVVSSLYALRPPRRDPIKIGLVAGALGCALGSANALYPAFDPFRFTRPADIPFESVIGSFGRATGGFVYPNNFGMYGSYVALAGILGLTGSIPRIRTAFSRAAVICGAAAVFLSASRAAVLGLAVGTALAVTVTQTHRRVRVMALSVAIAVAAGLLVALSPFATAIVRGRITSATSNSLTEREAAWRVAWHETLGHPLVGIGPSQSRLDSSWLLYLLAGGIIGFCLLILAAILVVKTDGAHTPFLRDSRWTIAVPLAATAVIQDSLGQTLVTWFPAVILGELIGRRPDVESAFRRGKADARVAGGGVAR